MGKWTVSCVPPLVDALNRKTPPNSSARSRMERKPIPATSSGESPLPSSQIVKCIWELTICNLIIVGPLHGE